MRGYKIVHGTKNDRIAKSIYDGSQILIHPDWQYYIRSGLFLGTSKKFCGDYYSCWMEEDAQPELLLTYEYEMKDLIKGDPTYSNGEIQVRRARIIRVEQVDSSTFV